MKILFPLIVCGWALAQQPASDAENAFSRQCEVRRMEFKDVTLAYVALIKAGPSHAAYEKLGSEYFKAGKLVQSVEAYERALKLDAKGATAVKGHAEVSAKLNKRNDRIKELEEQEAIDKDARLVCSRAAIMFHLGFLGDAVNALHEAEPKGYKNQDELKLLEDTFKMGIEVDKAVLRMILNDFQKAMVEKNQDLALSCFAEYQIISMGTGNTSGLVAKLNEAFGPTASEQVQKIL